MNENKVRFYLQRFSKFSSSSREKYIFIHYQVQSESGTRNHFLCTESIGLYQFSGFFSFMNSAVFDRTLRFFDRIRRFIR